MIDAITDVPAPVNEPPSSFAPGSPESSRLEERLKQLASERAELTMTIGGSSGLGAGSRSMWCSHTARTRYWERSTT